MCEDGSSEFYLVDGDISKTLVKYATDVNCEIRQEFPITLRNLLKQQPLEDILKHIHDFASTLLMVADDKTPEVRLRLVDQIPFIFRQCHEHASPDLEYYLYDRLLQIVLQYLQDEEAEVKREAYSALRMLLGKNILGKKRIEETICPAVLNLAQNVPNETQYEYNVTTAIMLIGRLAPIIGPEKTEEYFLDPFLEFCLSQSNGVRKICATIFPIVCHVMGSKITEEKLIETFLKLCDDVSWGVRKACPESIALISLICTSKCRKEILTPVVLKLSKDCSRWVVSSTLKILGQFIATFAEPCITGLAYTYNGELHITNPVDSSFKEHSDPEIVANYEHYLHLFSDQMNISVNSNIINNSSNKLNNNNNINNNNSNISIDINTNNSVAAVTAATITDNVSSSSSDVVVMIPNNNDYDNEKLSCEQIAQLINDNKMKLIKQITDDGYTKKDVIYWDDDCSWTTSGMSFDQKLNHKLIDDTNSNTYCNQIFSTSSSLISQIQKQQQQQQQQQMYPSKSIESLSNSEMDLSKNLIESDNNSNQILPYSTRKSKNFSPGIDNMTTEQLQELTFLFDQATSKIINDLDLTKLNETDDNILLNNDNSNNINILPPLNDETQNIKKGGVLNSNDHFFRKNTPSDLSLIIKKAIIYEGEEKLKKQQLLRSKILPHTDSSTNLQLIPETPLVYMNNNNDPLEIAASSLKLNETDKNNDDNDDIKKIAKEQEKDDDEQLSSSAEEKEVCSQNVSNIVDYSSININKRNKTTSKNNNNNININSNNNNNNNSYDDKVILDDLNIDADDAFQDYNSHKYWYISPELPLDDIVDDINNDLLEDTTNIEIIQIPKNQMITNNNNNNINNNNNNNNIINGDNNAAAATAAAAAAAANNIITERNLLINHEMSLADVFKEMSINTTNDKSTNFKTNFNHKMIFVPPIDYQQNIVPNCVLESFVKMVLFEDDEDMNLNCAYNFPAVALTIGKDNWHILKSLLQYLCDDLDWKVRKTIASSIDSLAMIVGKDIATKDLVPIYIGFFRDLDEVKIEAIRHFAQFLKSIDLKRHEEILSNIGICLRVDSKTNWRIKEDLAKQVLLLIQMYETLNKYDSLLYLTSLSGLFLEDKVSCVREIASDAMASIIRISNVKQQEAIIKYFLVKEFALSDSWRKRQTFLNIFYKLIKSHHRSINLFRTVLGDIKRLSFDSVPNIRLLVAKCLVQLITIDSNIVSSEKSEDVDVVEILRRLQQDDDRDVKEGSYSSVLPPKKWIGYYNYNSNQEEQKSQPQNDDTNKSITATTNCLEKSNEITINSCSADETTTKSDSITNKNERLPPASDGGDADLDWISY